MTHGSWKNTIQPLTETIHGVKEPNQGFRECRQTVVGGDVALSSHQTEREPPFLETSQLPDIRGKSSASFFFFYNPLKIIMTTILGKIMECNSLISPKFPHKNTPRN